MGAVSEGADRKRLSGRPVERSVPKGLRERIDGRGRGPFVRRLLRRNRHKLDVAQKSGFRGSIFRLFPDFGAQMASHAEFRVLLTLPSGSGRQECTVSALIMHGYGATAWEQTKISTKIARNPYHVCASARKSCPSEQGESQTLLAAVVLGAFDAPPLRMPGNCAFDAPATAYNRERLSKRRA